MSELLAWSRLRALIRNEASSSYRSWLIGSAVVVGSMLLNAVAVARSADGVPLYQFWFAATLFVWGTIASSLSFDELHNKNKNGAYLLLPASALEKTLTPLLYATIGIVTYLLVLMTVASLAIERFNRLAYGQTNELFNPFDHNLWETIIPCYLVVQSLFFLGAAWFRSVHYLKTVLALVLGAFALVTFLVIAAWVAGFAAFGPPYGADFGYWLFTSGDWLRAMLTIVVFVVLPFFCWYVAWLRVKETQVSHGV